MRTEKLNTRNELVYKNIKHIVPKSNLQRRVIDSPFKGITESGQPILYGKLGVSVEGLRKELLELNIPINKRQGGLIQQAMVTNDVAATTNRNNFCASSLFSRRYPNKQAVLNSHAKHLAGVYAKKLPQHHKDIMLQVNSGEQRIHPDWMIQGTPFTSGIINRDTSLGYHLDSKNLHGALSAMVVVKQSMIGGNLILPEYDVEFKMNDGTFLIFNGGDVIHGVTQMEKLSPEAHRISVVFYTAGAMSKCGRPQNQLVNN